jgi:hypothetical protein
VHIYIESILKKIKYFKKIYVIFNFLLHKRKFLIGRASEREREMKNFTKQTNIKQQCQEVNIRKY